MISNSTVSDRMREMLAQEILALYGIVGETIKEINYTFNLVGNVEREENVARLRTVRDKLLSGDNVIPYAEKMDSRAMMKYQLAALEAWERVHGIEKPEATVAREKYLKLVARPATIPNLKAFVETAGEAASFNQGGRDNTNVAWGSNLGIPPKPIEVTPLPMHLPAALSAPPVSVGPPLPRTKSARTGRVTQSFELPAHIAPKEVRIDQSQSFLSQESAVKAGETSVKLLPAPIEKSEPLRPSKLRLGSRIWNAIASPFRSAAQWFRRGGR